MGQAIEKPKKIFPHGLPQEVLPGLWQVQGSLPIPLPRWMTLWRMPNGKLLIYSAIALDEPGMAAVEALGEPGVLVVPHPLHTMDAAFFVQRYPGLQVIAPDDAAAKLPGVRIDVTPEKGLAALGLQHRIVPGLRYSEVMLELPTAGGNALLFTDLLAFGAADQWLLRLIGPPGGQGVPRIVRVRQVKDKAPVRSFLSQLAERPDIVAVLPSHCPAVLSGVQQALAGAVRSL